METFLNNENLFSLMENLNILKDLFDEKVIGIMNIFINNPEKQFYLSELSKLSRINISTTFRILNKLSEQGFLKMVVIGKVKMYQMDGNEKTRALVNFLKKGKEDPLDIFIEKIKTNPRVKIIIQESKTPNEAKILIVGDYLSKEKLQKTAEEIKEKYNFRISFAEIFESQFNDLKNFHNYGFEKKIIWKRT